MKSLKQIYDLYSNDKPSKGGDKGTLHSYIEFYEFLFQERRYDVRRVVEVGVHTGHSLALWRDYFPNAEIIGVEINRRRIREELVEGCKVIIGDATKEETFEGIDDIDIVIDDGSHKLEHQLRTFEILFSRMTDDGLYCIEDILDYDKDAHHFENLDSPIEVVYDGRHKTNNPTDVIITYRK